MGGPVDRLARRRSISRPRRATRRHSLHARHGRRHNHRTRSPRSRRTFLVSALSVRRATITPSGVDLVRRADAAGCHTLVLTLDVPVRTTRPREAATGLAGSFRVDSCDRPAKRAGARRGPWRSGKMAPRGSPTCALMRGKGSSLSELVAFTRRESGGAFTWDEVARYREWWKGNLDPQRRHASW